MSIFLPFASTEESRIKLLVQAASLPGSIIESIDVPYFGRKIKVHGDRVFQDWAVTVMNDQDFAIRAIMEKWHNEINTIVSNKLSTDLAPLNYKATAEVTQYSPTGAVIRAYKFNGIFPTQIEAIPLDWNQTNSIEQFGVQFAVDYWEPIDQSASSDQYSIVVSDDGITG